METNRSRNIALAGLFAAALLLTQLTAPAAIVGPYTADANTLHLWHMDTDVPVLDAVATGGTNLVALGGDATLTNSSAPGFGTALSTVDGGQANGWGTYADAFLTASSATRPTNIVITLADPATTAFTIEALVWIGFDPAMNLAARLASGGGTCTIMCGEANNNAGRIFQFRLDPIGAPANNPTVNLVFNNVHGAASPKPMSFPVPTTGPDAIASNAWYHVAAAYNGTPSATDNLRLYWTLLDGTRTNASLLGSTNMIYSLPVAQTCFALGNIPARTTNANFLGMIDEVRISSVARAADAMMFRPAVPQPVISSFSYDGSNLIMSGTNGAENKTYYVLAATNLGAAPIVWEPVFTNQFGPNGTFSVTNPVLPGIPTRFYMLQLP